MKPGTSLTRRAAAFLLAAFVLIGAEDSCSLAGLLAFALANQATITVDNLSDETLFVVVSTDDAYSGRSLAPGEHASIKTAREGTYHVVARTDPEALDGYGGRLNELQQVTHDLFTRSVAPADVKRKIDEIRQKLRDFRDDPIVLLLSATCSGIIAFAQTVSGNPEPVRRSAQVYRGPDGSLVASCGG